MMDWIQAHEALLFSLAGISTLVFVGTLLAVPWLVARIPHDYFAPRKRHRVPWADKHPALRALLLTGKNLIGLVFVVVGLALLLLPGQGLVTILIGIVLLDLPGKYRLERWVVGRPAVLRSINWLRGRMGRPPLVVKDDS
jgi:hypothetical protein